MFEVLSFQNSLLQKVDKFWTVLETSVHHYQINFHCLCGNDHIADKAFQSLSCRIFDLGCPNFRYKSMFLEIYVLIPKVLKIRGANNITRVSFPIFVDKISHVFSVLLLKLGEFI